MLHGGMEQFERDDSFAKVRVDESGLPATTYKRSGVGPVHIPTMVCLYGLVHAGRMPDEEATLGFWRANDWLLNHAFRLDSSAVTWPFPVDFKAPGHDLKAPWPSLMTQGLALSLLARAAQAADGPLRAELRKLARDALAFYDIPLERGGCSESLPNGAWFHEYPGGARVLNGHMFALFGAWEASTMLGFEAGALISNGLRALKAHLADFELHLPFLRWTRYDDGRIWYAGRKYHAVHVLQLRALAEVFSDAELDATAKRWGGWATKYPPRGASLLRHKAAFAVQRISQLGH
jgi:hypothetical protein